MLGELPNYWCHYLRGKRAGVVAPVGFARYLQRAWQLPSVADVPMRIVSLATRRVVGAKTGGDR